jgi:DNA-binding SARP family transcriptional activator
MLCAGEEVHLPRKALALLAYLALEGPADRSQIIALLWGNHTEDEARHALRQLLYRLRHTPAGACLQLSKEFLELSPGLEVDARAFLQAQKEGRFAPALALYRGAFLQGLDFEEESLEGWVAGWRERLRELWLGCLQAQAQALAASGEPRSALAFYRKLLQQDPLREQVHLEVMRLFAALGQTDQALRQYTELCRLLAEELGLEPLPETRALAESLRQGRVALPGEAAPFFPWQEVPFVGRQALLDQLEAVWAQGQVLVIVGEAGIGKSRLAQLFLSGKGPHLLLPSQPADAGIPYASMTRWLRRALEAHPQRQVPPGVRLEASRLVPELSPRAPPPLEEVNLPRFFAALVRLLRAHGETWLLEDLHYADLWSIRALWEGLERGEEGWGPVRLLITARPEEIPPELSARFQKWRGEGRAGWVELAPWSEAEVGELVARLSGRPARLFPRRLHQATAGNPLFVLETLRYLFEVGLLRVGPRGGWETPYDEETRDYGELPLAPSVRQTILNRLSLQRGEVQRCLEVASLLGEGDFRPEDLAGATALSLVEVAGALAEAHRARLLDQTPRGYRFAHDLVARSIAQALSPERKRAIAALLARHCAARPSHPARVAAYYEMAQEVREAARWWRKAALQAHALKAYAEAEAYYAKALAGLPARHPERFDLEAQWFYLSRMVGRGSTAERMERLQTLQRQARTPGQRAQVWFLRAITLEEEQDPKGALEASLKAWAYGRECGPGEAFYPLIFAARYRRVLGQLQEAQREDLEALGLAQLLTPYHLAEAQLGHALTLMLLGRPREALALVDEGEALLAERPSPPSSFWFLRERTGLVRALVLNSMGRFPEALPHTEALIQGARESGVLWAELVGLLVRAESWLGLAQVRQATEELERALDIAQVLPWARSQAQQLYAELELLLGNPRAALRLAEAALERAGGHPACRINALYSRGGAYLALGQTGSARRDLEEALALHGGINRFGSVSREGILARLSVTPR